MLYKFKSKATSDLIMFDGVGRQILNVLGKDPIKGIILAKEIPLAIEAIHAAVKEDDDRRQIMDKLPPVSTDEKADREDDITLHQRCVPFLDMLVICAKYNADVVWGI